MDVPDLPTNKYLFGFLRHLNNLQKYHSTALIVKLCKLSLLSLNISDQYRILLESTIWITATPQYSLMMNWPMAASQLTLATPTVTIATPTWPTPAAPLPDEPSLPTWTWWERSRWSWERWDTWPRGWGRRRRRSSPSLTGSLQQWWLIGRGQYSDDH